MNYDIDRGITRAASIMALEDIERRGLLSRRRLQVYKVICENGPMIGSHISKVVKERFGSWGSSETVRNRITELVESGAVEALGLVVDPNNGRIVSLFAATGRLPVFKTKVKAKTRKQLEKEIEELTEKLSWYEVVK